jgi:hypothetical protein
LPRPLVISRRWDSVGGVKLNVVMVPPDYR